VGQELVVVDAEAGMRRPCGARRHTDATETQQGSDTLILRVLLTDIR
jgi:hypothetical protein